MAKLKDVVYGSSEQLENLFNGQTVSGHTYNENDLYIEELGDDVELGAAGSGTQVNEQKQLIVVGKQDTIDSSHKLSADLVDDSSTINKFVTASDKTNWNGKVNVTDIVDNVTTTTTNVPLSANQGKVLNDRIDNLSQIGRFLSLWNCLTGLPTTNPTTMPYTYKTGDYYRVSQIAVVGRHIIRWNPDTSVDISITINDISITTSMDAPALIGWMRTNNYTRSNPYTNINGHFDQGSGSGVQLVNKCFVETSPFGEPVDIIYCVAENGESWMFIMPETAVTDTFGNTNYKPDGQTYTGAASSTQETEDVKAGDVYFYDGSTWSLQINHSGGTVADVKVNGTSIVNSGVANITDLILEDVKYTSQSLTSQQQLQARNNIGAGKPIAIEVL